MWSGRYLDNNHRRVLKIDLDALDENCAVGTVGDAVVERAGEVGTGEGAFPLLNTQNAPIS
jgi:hypothetical protein